MALAHNLLQSYVAGSKRHVLVETTFDSSYPTGGEAIAAVDFGLSTIDHVIVLGANAVAAGALVFQWDRVNSKLVAFTPATAHTHTAPAFTGAAPAFTGGGHVHVENTGVAYVQNANTASGTETGTVAVVTGTVAAIAAATAGNATEVGNTVSLATVKVHLQVIGN